MTHTSSTVPLIHTETEAGERVRSMFFRYLYAHSSRYFFTNRWFRLLIQLCLPINQNRGDSERDDTQPNAANADKIVSQPRKSNAQMETENRAGEKNQAFLSSFFSWVMEYSVRALAICRQLLVEKMQEAL